MPPADANKLRYEAAMLPEKAASDAVEVRVAFTALQPRYAIEGAGVVSLPAECGPERLSATVNALLGLRGGSAVAFGFLLDGALVQGAVGAAAAFRARSLEEVIAVEYFAAAPAVGYDGAEATENDEWVGALCASGGGELGSLKEETPNEAMAA